MSSGNIDTIIWDLGGVLIDWNPRYLYRKLLASEEEVEWFLREVCTPDWNENQDAGYPIAMAVEEKVKEFPRWEEAIRAYYGRWTEMLAGPIPGSVELLKRLREESSLRQYALTNWSAETFPIALARYEFLHWFDGRVVSGEEKTRKPHPEIFRILFERFMADPARTLFIDDSERNVNAARAIGIRSLVFRDPPQLESALKTLHLLT